MPDTSPTKSASFFPDTWYRKTYEETPRTSTRPAPEGAGSMPSSIGTPSPGSGISSPGSFSGSPGTISPGIGTESPGSLGGSPGFGTGSPASGSGSSPGSERGIWCENCNARLTELKRQALKLLIPGPYSSKVKTKVSPYVLWYLWMCVFVRVWSLLHMFLCNSFCHPWAGSAQQLLKIACSFINCGVGTVTLINLFAHVRPVLCSSPLLTVLLYGQSYCSH